MDTENIIRREFTIGADAATVFAFFTDSQRLIRWMGVSAQLELEHLPRQAREYLAAETDSADDSELPNFDIQVVHARFAGVGFELLEGRDGRGCDHFQQFVYPGTDGRWRTVGDLVMHVLV